MVTLQVSCKLPPQFAQQIPDSSPWPRRHHVPHEVIFGHRAAFGRHIRFSEGSFPARAAPDLLGETHIGPVTFSREFPPFPQGVFKRFHDVTKRLSAPICHFTRLEFFFHLSRVFFPLECFFFFS